MLFGNKRKATRNCILNNIVRYKNIHGGVGCSMHLISGKTDEIRKRSTTFPDFASLPSAKMCAKYKYNKVRECEGTVY